jgi:hypothetical protein
MFLQQVYYFQFPVNIAAGHGARPAVPVPSKKRVGFALVKTHAHTA